MKRLVAALSTILLTAGLLVAPSSASAAPRDIDNASLESVRDAYLTWLWPALRTEKTWNGDPAKCVGSPAAPAAAQPAAAVGSFGAAGQAAMLDAVNYFREMAGLRPVVENIEGSDLARQAALIMTANGVLTHEPTPDLKCFSVAGGIGAHGNIAGGSGARAVAGLIDDYGDNNTTVGHRRWLLNPVLSGVGLGSTSAHVVTVVFGQGSTRTNTRPTGGTPWPSAGFVPWEVAVPESGRWSYSAPGVDFSAASIVVTKNGVAWPVTRIHTGGPFGDPAVVWTGGRIAAPAVGAVDVYDITINGVSGGPVRYQVKLFRAGVAKVGSVAVTGEPVVGQTLTATAQSVVPSDAFVNYAWYVDGTRVSDQRTYSITAKDVGKRVVAEATAATLYDNWASSATRSAALTVKPGTFAPEGVRIDGRPVVGERLGFVEGSWGIGVRAAFNLQWLRDGKAVSGADRYFYTLTSADLGATIALRVTGSAPGYTSATVTTAGLGPVTAPPKPPAPPSKFTTIPTPKISGTAQVGKTLTAKPGTWAPTPTGLGYQWYRNGKAIANATGRTYQLPPATKGGTITVRVTATRAGYVTTTSKASKATKKVKAGTITAVKPKISGTVRVDHTLTAVPGAWKPATTTFSYQWYRNGSKIKGATKATYTLKSADKGKKISVKVTGRATGYTTKAKTSARTGKVGARA